MRLIRLLRFWREDAAGELEEELRFHLERRIADGLAAGLGEAEARARALQRLGDLGRVRAEVARVESRRARRLRLAQALGDLRQDLLFAARQLWRERALTAGIVLALALGLGANAALFGAVDALVLRPLSGVGEADRLVVVDQRSISAPALRDLAAQAKQLEVAGFSHRTFALASSEAIEGAVVSGDYFRTLRVAAAAAGRLLGPDDDLEGAPLAAVVAHGFPAAVGDTLLLNGRTVPVVGVAAEGFAGTRVQRRVRVFVTVAAWRSLLPSDLAGRDFGRRDWNWLTLVGRLRPGATLPGARGELRRLAEQLAGDHPGSTRYSLELVPASLAATGLSSGEVRLFAGGLAAVVALVLLLACANVANLLLARGAARSRELAVRLALGASRGRLVRQLLTESLLLALLGGVCGFGLAALAGEALSGLRLPDGARLPLLGLGGNGRALAFCAALSLGSTLIFGLAPALHATRGELVDALKDGGADARARSRLRSLLLIAQVAFSMALLAGAGLLLRGLAHALQLEVGFRPEKIAFATVDPGLVRQQPAQALVGYREAARLARAGASAAGFTSALPLSGDQDTYSFTAPGCPQVAGVMPEAEVQVVDAGYFAVLGLPLLEGRTFAPREEAGPVAVINQTLARRCFAGGALGARVRGVTLEPATVVGVVADARYHGLDETPMPLFYLPLDQQPRLSAMTLLARGEGDPRALVPALRAAIGGAAPGVPILAAGTLSEQLADLLTPQRLGLGLVGAFAALGLLLACVGTTSVVAFNLARRTRELGIRLALGADGRALLRLVLGEVLRELALGAALGLALGAAGARALASLLYGLSPADPLAWAAAAGALLAAGTLAAWLPARRVLRLDPLAALKSE